MSRGPRPCRVLLSAPPFLSTEPGWRGEGSTCLTWDEPGRSKAQGFPGTLRACPVPGPAPDTPVRVRDETVLQCKSHSCSLSAAGAGGLPALGSGSLGILRMMGPGAGVGRKEQKDKGGEGGEGSGGSRARGAALSRPLQRRPSHNLSALCIQRPRCFWGLLCPSKGVLTPRGKPGAAPANPSLWRAFLTSRDVRGMLGKSLAGGFPVWHLLSPSCKAPGVATALPRGPRMGSS